MLRNLLSISQRYVYKLTLSNEENYPRDKIETQYNLYTCSLLIMRIFSNPRILKTWQKIPDFVVNLLENSHSLDNKNYIKHPILATKTLMVCILIVQDPSESNHTIRLAITSIEMSCITMFRALSQATSCK